MTPLVVVAGAGLAGLAAATAAADARASVVLFEEGEEPGGQLLYRAQPLASGAVAHPEQPYRLAARLIADAVSAGAEVRTGALVAGCFPGNELLVVAGGRVARIVPDAFIVATGSTDLPYPFAGATFPGVLSARGLQILMNRHRVRPGRRFAVIGGGRDAEELAVDIMLAEGEVIWSGIAPSPFLRAIGADGVRGLMVGQDAYDVDVIVIAVGRQADAALAVMVGTPLAFSAELGGLVPVVDERLQCPIPKVFVAGDAAGVGSVGAMLAEGHLAGVSAAASLGLATEADVIAAREAGGPELAWRIELRRSLAPVPTQPSE